MSECVRLANCGFFKKYQQTKDLACKGFLLKYCTGTLQPQCKRMAFSNLNGYPPPDDMMPTGQIMISK